MANIQILDGTNLLQTIGTNLISGINYFIHYSRLQVGGADVSTTNPVPMVAPAPATSATSNVVASASLVTILAANTVRLGATVMNESTAVLYLKMGATASLTSYSVQVPAGGYYEVPFRYVGVLTGLWASANGSARVTELTL